MKKRRKVLRGPRFVGVSLAATALLMTIALLAFGCNPQSQAKVERARFVLGSTAHITAYGQGANQAVDKVFDELHRLEKITNLYDPSSEVMALNRSRDMVVSGDLFNIIQRCQHYSELSHGAFDITIGGLTKLWNITEGTRAEWPSPKKIKSQAAHVGYQSIKLDPKTNRVKIEEPHVVIDVWGAAKGYAAQRAIEILKANGVRSAFVNLGSSMMALGTPPQKDAWVVGIQHPRRPGEILGIVTLHDGEALATSGDYERFQLKGNDRISHIFNPKTGRPIHEMESVTIKTTNALDADILSTTAFVLGAMQSKKVLQTLPDVSYLLVDIEGNIHKKWN